MITRMSKVEIVGPRGALQDVISLLQRLQVLQLDSEAEFLKSEEGKGEGVAPFLRDERERTLFERLFLEDIRRRIDDLFRYLPTADARTSYIEPRSILHTVYTAVEKHVRTARTLYQRREDLVKEREEQNRFASFLITLYELFPEGQVPPTLMSSCSRSRSRRQWSISGAGSLT